MSENGNIRTMEFICDDFWGRPTYKCTETGRLWKDITLGSERPQLCSCGNDIEGEPDSPIKPDLEIHYVGREPEPDKFNYMMLSRLRSDCDYYLGYGHRNEKQLWAGDEKGQIDEMKRLWNVFPEDKKPEWLSLEEILQYEQLMTA